MPDGLSKYQWLTPASKVGYSNYVQKQPAPAPSKNVLELHESVAKPFFGNSYPIQDFGNDMTRSVSGARDMLRRMADISIAQHGLTDDRTKRLTDILSSPGKEDAYLREIFPSDKVDEDRIALNKAGEKVASIGDQEDAARRKREFTDPFLDGVDIPSLGIRSKAKQELDAVNNNRAVAQAYINTLKKDNPDLDKEDDNELNRKLIGMGVDTETRKQALDLINGDRKKRAYDKFFDDVNADPMAFSNPAYYTAAAAKKSSAKLGDFIDSVKNELNSDAESELASYRDQMEQWRRSNMAIAGNNPADIAKVQAAYYQAIDNAKKVLEQKRYEKYSSIIPINDKDTEAMRYTFNRDKVYDMSPQQAGLYLSKYRDTLYSKKKLENPDLDESLFNTMWQHEATIFTHSRPNGQTSNQTILGIKMNASADLSAYDSMGVEQSPWKQAFGQNKDALSSAKEMLDRANKSASDNINGKTGLGLAFKGISDNVTNEYRELLASIATLMDSDEKNDARMAEIKSRISEGYPATFDENQLLQAVKYKEMADELSGRGNMMYQGGNAVLSMVPYTIQFLVGNKMSSLTGITKLEPVFRSVEGAKLSVGARSLNVLKNFGRQLANAGMITAMFPEMANMNINRRLYSETTTVNPEGDFNPSFKKNDATTATVKGVGEALIDNYTEMLGIGIDRAMHYTGKNLLKAGTKMGLGKAIAAVDRAGNKLPFMRSIAGITTGGRAWAEENATKGVRSLINLSGANSIAGEYLEEEASRNLQALILNDNNGKLQFMDKDFLQQTGTSVAMFSLLQGGILGGINTLSKSKVKVQVPRYTDNGSFDGFDQLNVPKKALEVISEHASNGTLTDSKISSIASRYGAKEAEYITRYGQSALNRANEKMEVDSNKEAILQSGVKEDELSKVTSVTQANEIAASRDLIDSGYASVSNEGNVRVDLKKLNSDIAAAERSLSDDTIDPEKAVELSNRVNELSRLKAEYVSRHSNSITGHINLPSESVSVSDHITEMHRIQDDLKKMYVQPSSAKSDKQIAEKKAALGYLSDVLRETLTQKDGSGEWYYNNFIDSLQDDIDQKSSVLQSLKSQLNSSEGADAMRISDSIDRTSKELSEMNRTMKELTDFRVAHQDEQVNTQTSADRMQLLQQQQEQEDQLTPEMYNGEEAAPEDQTSVPEEAPTAAGPLMVKGLVRVTKSGKLFGNSKLVAKAVAPYLDLPTDVKHKVKIEDSQVTLEITSSGKSVSYPIMSLNEDGSTNEVNPEALRTQVANDILTIRSYVRLEKELKPIVDKSKKALANEAMALVVEMESEKPLKDELLKSLEPDQVEEIIQPLSLYAKSTGKSIGEAILSVVSAMSSATTVLKKDGKPLQLSPEQVEAIIDAIPGSTAAVESQLASLGSEGLNIDRMVKSEIARTVNGIENSEISQIAAYLTDQQKKQLFIINNTRESIAAKIGASSKLIADIDAAIGSFDDYDRWLMSNDATRTAYKASHNSYELIKEKSKDEMPTLSQQQTIMLFNDLKLISSEEVPAQYSMRDANEIIHRGVLRMYALHVGTASSPVESMASMKEFHRLVNSLTGATRDISSLSYATTVITRMVNEYNSRFNFGIQGKSIAELDAEVGPSIVAIAADYIKKVEDRVNEYSDYIEAMRGYVDGSTEERPKKPKAINFEMAESLVNAIASYAKRLNMFVDGASTITEEIVTKEAKNLALSISTANSMLKELNKELYGKANPMIGGTSIDSPALKGETARECLQNIISANGENAVAAKMVLSRLGDVKLSRHDDVSFNKLLDKHNLNFNTVAFYLNGEVFINEQTGNHEHALIHELMHSQTVDAITSDSDLSSELNSIFNGVKESMEKAGFLSYKDGVPSLYGFTSPAEFMAEFFANGDFFRMIRIATEGNGAIASFFRRLMELIRSALGIPKKVTVYDRMIQLSGAMSNMGELYSKLLTDESEKSVAYALASESQGTPSEKGYRNAIVEIVSKMDRMNPTVGMVSYIKIEDRILSEIANNADLYADILEKYGISADTDGVQKMLEAAKADSMFRYMLVRSRVKAYMNQHVSSMVYNAAAGDAMSSAESRVQSQMDAFSSIIKEMQKMSDETRDSLESQLIAKLQSLSVMDDLRNQESYELYVDALESNVDSFSHMLGAVLKSYSYGDFKSAVTFYKSARVERHIKIMYDREGKPIIDTVNTGVNSRRIDSQFLRHVTSFSIKSNGKRYIGMPGLLEYVSDSHPTLAKNKVSRMDEYNHELILLQNITGIPASAWDTFLDSDGYDCTKILSVYANGAEHKVKMTFRSYKHFIQTMNSIKELYADGNSHTVGEIKNYTGYAFPGNNSSYVAMGSTYGFFMNKYGKWMEDVYPLSVMTSSIISKLNPSYLSKTMGSNQLLSGEPLEVAAMSSVISLLSGTVNEQNQNVRSNLDKLASSLGNNQKLVSSGFGVDNNRISGISLNSSLHRIAESMLNLELPNKNMLQEFYKQRGTNPDIVILNGVIDLTDRDNPKTYDKLNPSDWWASQMTLFRSGGDSYYALMGVFSDKSVGRFIRAPKYSLTWNDETNSFEEYEGVVAMFPDFQESLSYFIHKYGTSLYDKNSGLTSEMEKRLITEFFYSFIMNMSDINDIFQGEGYKNLTDMIKRGAPIISPGYNPLIGVEGGFDSNGYTHAVISDIIGLDEKTGEYELANGIQFATRGWFDKLAASIGDVYAKQNQYGKLSSTKSLVTGINRSNGKRFLTKTNIICIDDIAAERGGRWEKLRKFMHDNGIETVSSPSGTKKNAHVVDERFSQWMQKDAKGKTDNALNLFGLDEIPAEVAQAFTFRISPSDLYIQQDLRHEAEASQLKMSKQMRSNFQSISLWNNLMEGLINDQIESRISLFRDAYKNIQSDEDKKLLIANSVLVSDGLILKKLNSVDDVAQYMVDHVDDVDQKDREMIMSLINPNTKLSYPTIQRWVRTKLSSAIRKTAIEVKVNRTATQELPDLNQDHYGYRIVDSTNSTLLPYLKKIGISVDIKPAVALAEASTTDSGYGTKSAMRGRQEFEFTDDTFGSVFFEVMEKAVSYADMYHLNKDGSMPTVIHEFTGEVPDSIKLHEITVEERDGKKFIILPGEPFITNRVPGSSLVSHSVVRLKQAFPSDVNYTILNLQAQLASGSDFDGDARYNQLLKSDRSGRILLNASEAGRNNQIILIAAEAYSEVQNYDRIVRPLDVNYANETVEAIRKKRRATVSDLEKWGMKPSYSMFDPIGYDDARTKNNAGVTMKAIMANLNSAFSFLKSLDVDVNYKAKNFLSKKSTLYYNFSNPKYNGKVSYQMKLGKPVVDRYDIIKKVIENELNKAFDNAKDPMIEDQGITESTANLFVFMLSTSERLRDIEGSIAAKMETLKTWDEKHQLLDELMSEATKEADAIFTYLNSPIVQSYITLTRSSSIGTYISSKEIFDQLLSKYSEDNVTLLKSLLMYANDLRTIQDAFNASDTNIATVDDFVKYSNAVSSVLSGSLNYFDFNGISWNSVPNWMVGSVENIKMHASIMYGTAVEYSPIYREAVTDAASIMSSDGEGRVTKQMRSVISNSVIQVISIMAVNPSLSMQSLERRLVGGMRKAILNNTSGNLFVSNMMISGVGEASGLSNAYTKLSTKMSDDEMELVRQDFDKFTAGKSITIDGEVIPLSTALYLYQLMKFGNESTGGGFLEYISNDAIADYSSKFVSQLSSMNGKSAQHIKNVATAYAVAQATKRSKSAKSVAAKVFRYMSKNELQSGSFDAAAWNGVDVGGMGFSKAEKFDINRLGISTIEKLIDIISTNDLNLISEAWNEYNIDSINSLIGDYISKNAGAETMSAHEALKQMLEKVKENIFPVESMEYTMDEEDNIYLEKTSTRELIADGRRTSTTRSFPLGVRIGDAYAFNPDVVVGRVFTVKDISDKYYAVTKVNPVTLDKVFDKEFISQWSNLEGWTESRFYSSVAPRLLAGKILYQTIFREISKQEAEFAKENNGSIRVDESQIVEVKQSKGYALSDKYVGKLIWASPSSGKTMMALTLKDQVVDSDDILRDQLSKMGVNVSKLSNRQVGFEMFKLLKGKTMQQRQSILKGYVNEIARLKKEGKTVLSGNTFFMEDMPHTDFGGKMKKWVDEWFILNEKDMQYRMGMRADFTSPAKASELYRRIVRSVDGLTNVTIMEPGAMLSEAMGTEAGNLMQRVNESANKDGDGGFDAKKMINLQQLMDRIEPLLSSGFTLQEAVDAIARELKCR